MQQNTALTAIEVQCVKQRVASAVEVINLINISILIPDTILERFSYISLSCVSNFFSIAFCFSLFDLGSYLALF